MNLYLRLLRVFLGLAFVRRSEILAASRVRFRVWPLDCDLNFHLNNGRYLTFMDLGRVHLMAQTGLLRQILRRRWAPIVSAAEISFIRPLAPLRAFELVTRVLGWDEKYFYLEQRFERAGTLHAVALVKALLLAGRQPVPCREVVESLGETFSTPPLPEMLRHWKDLAELKKRGGGAAG